MASERSGIDKLQDVMGSLRDPERGCPWDLKQTNKSLIPYTIEEAYEVAHAIEQGCDDELKGELGDLLFQIVFYSQIAAEENRFTFNDVATSVAEKLIVRHPHVFGDTKFETDQAFKSAWEEQKANERKEKAQNSLLDDIPMALPALKRATKIQKRVSHVGFDWSDSQQVLDKIVEEAREVEEAKAQCDPSALAEEVGDLLFSCVNLSRHLGVDAEQALQAANKKFMRRFRALEAGIEGDGKSLADCSIEELEQWWLKVKNSE
ncbi:MAG: nucleoside triphosphate pyrophosphohydrolase [Kangiellaceae bacterium]|nr:nucleoside triphosphate pyrophosphohydrolase [Kangiellaceae bacterium]|tara:strand:+ start:7280 stop:8068 length:789 start_codon:yes stop_codon:yes gene_type:complete